MQNLIQWRVRDERADREKIGEHLELEQHCQHARKSAEDADAVHGHLHVHAESVTKYLSTGQSPIILAISRGVAFIVNINTITVKIILQST